MESRRRLVILAILMVLLVSIVSSYSTYHLYDTALHAQRKRMQELVQSQASLVSELGLMALRLQQSGGQPVSRDIILNHISRAHSSFQLTTQSGEFTVARRAGDEIVFLIVNGEKVGEAHRASVVPMDGPMAVPMQLALCNQTGTVIGLDYRGVEVLAAYTPITLQFEILGLVAKIDTAEIKAPFIRANAIIIFFGIILTGLCVLVFFKVSEPIIRDVQRRERQYRNLVEGANNFILRVDENGVVNFANRFAEEKLVVEGDGIIGMSFFSLVTPGIERMELAAFTEFYAKELAHKHFETTLRDGRTAWLSWVVNLIREDEESGDELLCVGYDMTNIHIASEAKREVEERFRGIAKASPVGIVITSNEGTLLYANEMMHKLTGAEPVELAGMGWLERVHGEDRFMVRRAWFGEGTSSRRLEFRMTTKDEKTLWVLGQIVDLSNSHGQDVGNVMTFTDITRMKRAELVQQRFTAAIDQAAEMIFITDLNSIITYVNPAFEKVTGYTKSEAVGENPSMLHSGEHDADFYAGLWGVLGRGENWVGRFINKKKSGETYTQQTTIGPIRDGKREVIGYVGVARDISEQLVAEGQLRQSQKLESIGELAAGIAHEINTPAQYVMSNLQFLEDSFTTIFASLDKGREIASLVQASSLADQGGVRDLLASLIDEDDIEYLKEDIPSALRESADGLNRISEIVQSVKQLAHPGEVNKSYHSINEILRNAATVSSNEWKYVAAVEFKFAEDLPRVNCLKGEIGQVALNLIVNGAHAIETKRSEGEERGVISLRTYPDGTDVVIEVEDNGTGIPQHAMDRIFDPFFTTKDVGKGTGQGLAIAHNVVVNMHSGSINVKTEEGVGTRFVMRLPVNG